MEEKYQQLETPKFASPEEELRYLRERVAEREQQLAQAEQPAQKEAVISREIVEYAKTAPSAQLEEHLILDNPQFEEVIEHLHSIPHAEKMRELYRVLSEKGILNAIKVTQSLDNPHIEDDFHRVLVEYIRTGAIVPGLDRERTLSKALHMTVFEVTLPFAGGEVGSKVATFKEVITSMERFYIGMLPSGEAALSGYGPFSLELVLSNFSNDIVFYVGVQDHMKDLFMKQILGSFPMARIEEAVDDYNIFNEFGAAVGSYALPSNNFVYPIQFADNSDTDPLTVVLNSFTKIERDGEGAAIQFIIYPDTEHVENKIRHATGQIKQGVSIGRATDIPLSTGGVIAKTVTEFFHTQIKAEKKEDKKPDGKSLEFTEKALSMLQEKITSPLLRANIRVVVSAPERARAEAIRTAIEASFSQFARPQGNGIKFVHAEKSELKELLHNFTYRLKDDDAVFMLNTKELSTMYHVPLSVSQKDAPQLKTVKASSAPAPVDIPSEGTLLGVNKFRGESRQILMTKSDRLRHCYVIGQTGTGKTTLLKNMIIEDIKAGNGVCFIDPHGSDVQDILANIPKERIDDVIYFDPSYTPRPFALNMLEYDVTHPEQKIFVVNELLSIFKKLYSSTPESMGPAFEQYFRNATMLVMEDPETGNTLLEIPRVLADVNFRNLKLSRCKNPIVVQFWRDIAAKSTGEASLANMVPYITNKFDVFLSNDVVRPIIAQENSSFNFRDIMDNKKILLVNLAKGKLGDINANLIGLVLVGKILMAALSRVDSFGKPLPDFYLYIDEFQNVTTDSISAILSEARKYGLSLTIAHQFIAQIDEGIKKAVFGNVGSMAVFRVGAEDAEFLASQFAPIFSASDIMKIENHNAYMKMLINGRPVPPFNIETLPPPQGHSEIVEQLQNLSYLRFGKDRKVVDDAIMKKYLTSSPSAQSAAQVERPVAPPASVGQQSVQSVAVPVSVTPAPVISPLPSQSISPTPLVQSTPQVSAPAQSPLPTPPPSQNQFAQAFARVPVMPAPRLEEEVSPIVKPATPLVAPVLPVAEQPRVISPVASMEVSATVPTTPVFSVPTVTPVIETTHVAGMTTPALHDVLPPISQPNAFMQASEVVFTPTPPPVLEPTPAPLVVPSVGITPPPPSVSSSPVVVTPTIFPSPASPSAVPPLTSTPASVATPPKIDPYREAI